MSYSGSKKPRALGDSIWTLLKSLGIETKVKQYEALNNWSYLVGEKVASVTKADKVTDGILFVKVKNSVWRNELLYMKKDILNKLNKSLGADIIKDIWFV
ncbi:DUF721 domain-containing protein [candidate division KSB1 bacterium]|nr:DUF721 domain-containing protein [candidate division KSB1 bacterium]NIR72477.1 DUF721 domain-containing protein [candidate division KSB1 bacterium]NIS24062.1 DUF721 domain-containing protein [candidate division KSB1 bacterium]NIT70981.1 DUF721 domain-containing protein [candidate division KSB1 bacterium]NIU27392.1 DUF721 domain-containing protein [candidate division KSB1 bacterium]